jgi:hypothetical protein
MQPIGYFTDCRQAEDLVRKFGDKELKELPDIDQAALVVALAGLMMANIAGITVDVSEAAEACIPVAYDLTSDAIQEALVILDGITPDDAIGILQFLVQ